MLRVKSEVHCRHMFFLSVRSVHTCSPSNRPQTITNGSQDPVHREYDDRGRGADWSQPSISRLTKCGGVPPLPICFHTVCQLLSEIKRFLQRFCVIKHRIVWYEVTTVSEESSSVLFQQTSTHLPEYTVSQPIKSKYKHSLLSNLKFHKPENMIINVE